MRQAGIAGIHRRKRRGCTRRDGTEPSDDLVNRSFDPTMPDRLWVMDVTEHPTEEGKVYVAVVPADPLPLRVSAESCNGGSWL